MEYKKVVLNGYVLGTGIVETNGNITKEEFDIINEKLHSKPIPPENYNYKLKDISYEWELIENLLEEEDVNVTK